ncbi:hypothetical protein I79_017853 [Cricetulus griseus]|uniref:Uncharacterized protein n=1 Tax=Cricetulus griseus TaxID=10029 RepID=G3I352_CRIGR|nr:hypothetical protein I79_017853 [Cricetulus griseus]
MLLCSVPDIREQCAAEDIFEGTETHRATQPQKVPNRQPSLRKYPQHNPALAGIHRHYRQMAPDPEDQGEFSCVPMAKH